MAHPGSNDVTIVRDDGEMTPEELEAHNQAMINKADGEEGDTEDKTGEGEKLYAGKYKTVEEMEQALLSMQSGDKSDDDESGDDKPNLKISDEADAAKELEAKGIDYDALTQEYFTDGELSADSRKALVDAGIPEKMIDNHIEMLELKANQQKQAVFGVTGGEEGYGQMVEWARGNLSKDEIAAFNSSLDAGPTQAILAVRGLYAQYAAENGEVNPNQVKANAQSGTQSSYQSIAEMQRDMRDPRYDKDPAYRAQVERKLFNSNLF